MSCPVLPIEKLTQPPASNSIICILRNGIDRPVIAGFSCLSVDFRNRAGTDFPWHQKTAQVIERQIFTHVLRNGIGHSNTRFPKIAVPSGGLPHDITWGRFVNVESPARSLSIRSEIANALRRSRWNAPKQSCRRLPAPGKADDAMITFPGSPQASNRARPNTAAAPSSSSRAPG